MPLQAPKTAPVPIITPIKPPTGTLPGIDDNDTEPTRTVTATKLSSPGNDTTTSPTVAPVPNMNIPDTPPSSSSDGSATAESGSNDSGSNLATTDSVNTPTGNPMSLSVLVGMGIMIGVFIVVMAIFANKYYHRRKKYALQHDADIEKDEFTESATPLDINTLEQAHLRNVKGSMFGGQRHPASLPMKTEGPKLSNRTRPNPLTIDTRKANLFGNAVRSGALPFAPANQRKASTSGRSPLSQNVETVENATDNNNNPEISVAKPLTGDTVQSRAAGRFRNNNLSSATLQVSEPYNKASPTWINGKPELDRSKSSPSPTNRRRAAVDQFVKAQQAAINGESEEFIAEEQGSNEISVVVSSFINQDGREEEEMEDVNFEEPQVNIRALSDYDEREMVQRSPQHSEGLNISDNAHYAQWNQDEQDILEIHHDENDEEEHSSRDGSEQYRNGKRPEVGSEGEEGEDEEGNDAESWHEGLESYIITEESPDNTNQPSTSIDSINQLAVTYPEVWYRPSPAPTPTPRSANQADANQKSASIRPVRLHYQGKRPKRVLLQLKEEEEEGMEFGNVENS